MSQTIGEWLEKLADSNQSSEQDSNRMQNLLHRVGFLKARVVLGIVYLDGHGTIESPPANIHTIARGFVTKAIAVT